MRQNLEEEIYDAGSIVEVITLAHKYAMQDEQLGFFMYDRSVANPANFQVDAAESDGYEPSIAPDPQPDEVPVDKLEGEPL
jgi:predicted ATPase